jgi:uroporphyrinogen III methyltransferase/synthase
LAKAQVNEVYDMVPHLGYSMTELKTYGDKHREVSLWDKDIPADFFTRELDERCLIFPETIAVHSAKDMPFPVTEGLEIYAVTKGRSKTDSLVTRTRQTLDELPAGSRIATSSPSRRKQLLALRPDLQAVSIRGNIEERIEKVMNGEVDGLIVATCALQRLGLTHLQAEVLPFKTHPLQGNLAVVGVKNGELKEEFEWMDIRRRFGQLTIVGAGPGNAGSLTLDGAAALRRAKVVFYDDLIGEDLIAQFRKAKVEWIYVGKRCGAHSYEQDEINEMLLQNVLKGRNVVRLKGGDPMVFAHVREEIDYVQMGTLKEVRVIPGVTAGIAAAALSQTPLTQRGVASSVAFALGHGSEIQTPDTDTVVYYMCGNNLARIADALLNAGRPSTTPAVIGCDVTRPDQRFIYTQLGDLQYAAMKTSIPIILIVGEVAACDEHIRRFQRTLHTEAVPIIDIYERDFDDPFNTYTPLIERTPNSALYCLTPNHFCAPEHYDWVVFTSSFTVQCFSQALCAVDRSMNHAFHGVKVASVGPTTSRLLQREHVDVAMESPSGSAAGILEYFRAEVHQPQRILLPHSDIAYRRLSDGLKALGHQVVDAVVYTTRPNLGAQRVDLTEYKRIYFASPSGVDAFVQLYGALPEGTLLQAKGETTLEKLIKELENEKI